jgi:hypothetical protein
MSARSLQQQKQQHVASVFVSIVLPSRQSLTGCPYNRTPRTGARSPEKMSARSLQQQKQQLVASAFVSIVLPSRQSLTGGPYNTTPRTGARSPEKMSARSLQQQQQQHKQQNTDECVCHSCSNRSLSEAVLNLQQRYNRMPHTGARSPKKMSACSLKWQQ